MLFYENLRPLSVGFHHQSLNLGQNKYCLNLKNLSAKFTLNAKISHQMRHGKAKKQENAAKTKEQKAKI